VGAQPEPVPPGDSGAQAQLYGWNRSCWHLPEAV